MKKTEKNDFYRSTKWSLSLRFCIYCTINLVIVTSTVFVASAQPNSPACKDEQELIANLNNQVSQLESKKNSSIFSGPAATLYANKMKSLQTQLSQAQIVLKAACSVNGSGLGSGYITPMFLVTSVIYAPPGMTGKTSTSYIDYGSSTQLGSSVSSTKTFKKSAGVTVTAKAEFAGNGASASIGYTASESDKDKSVLDLKKTQQSDIKVTGPEEDGVDHDMDQIWFWVQPSVLVSVFNQNISWDLNTNEGVVQYLTVGQLKKFVSDSTSIDNDPVGAPLKAIGFQQSDFKAMLDADPFWNGIYIIDPSRFVRLAQTFPYEPSSSSIAGSILSTYSLKNDAMTTYTTDTTVSNDLKVSVTATAGFGAWSVSATAKFDWTWTNENSYSSSTDNTQTATLAIGQPSPTYRGYTVMGVYWDNLWQTFLFVPLSLTGQYQMSGVIFDKRGIPIPHANVVLDMGTTHLITYANSAGHYVFYLPQNKIPKTAVLISGNLKQNVSLKSKSKSTIANLKFSN
jgi:hypothetical protein